MRLPIIAVGLVVMISCKVYDGSYCSLTNSTGACIEFINKTEAQYYTGTDQGGRAINYGKYKIKKDTLIVNFEKIPNRYKLDSDEQYNITFFEQTSSDSVQIEVICRGVRAANVYGLESNSNAIVFGSTIESDKEVTFTIPKGKLPIDLIAESGKSKVVTNIKENGNYKIEITLNEEIGGTSYNSRLGTISKFLIKRKEGVTHFEQIGNEEQGKYYKKNNGDE